MLQNLSWKGAFLYCFEEWKNVRQVSFAIGTDEAISDGHFSTPSNWVSGPSKFIDI